MISIWLHKAFHANAHGSSSIVRPTILSRSDTTSQSPARSETARRTQACFVNKPLRAVRRKNSLNKPDSNNQTPAEKPA